MNEKKTPPDVPAAICSDRIIQYARLNHSVGFNRGHGLFFVGGKEIGPVPRLAICEHKEPREFILYYCDHDWSPIGIAPYDSVEAAKRRAEKIYPGSLACWAEADFTEDDVARYLEATYGDHCCSFCGKRPDEANVDATFEGQGDTRICSNCVRQYYAEL